MSKRAVRVVVCVAVLMGTLITGAMLNRQAKACDDSTMHDAMAEAGREYADAIQEQYNERTAETMLDVSALNGWCGDGWEDGTIRMVGAWMVEDDEGLYTLEDETGNLWQVADVCIYPDDFLLLWIADSNTPDDVGDDLIIKAWAEVH